ncbi:hypothetical protein DFS33DRAFT_1272505 [Desarmillaria ectypa]|nr:hypothetical protein DFS33DRAFT_1272505 [Desarmillaria ectypa]
MCGAKGNESEKDNGRVSHAQFANSNARTGRSESFIDAKARCYIQVLDEDGFALGTDRAEKARIQCARYALQILSNTGLRSHALATLIDRDRIQLSYYDRSAIIVSQAIDLANKDDEILFIAMLIGCHRLTLKQRGILHHIIEDPYITDFNRFNTVSKDPKTLFCGLIMNLERNSKAIKLKLGKTVYRQRGLIGRDTCVICATCTEWSGMKLVVKISWPSASRKSEKALLDIAKAKAKQLAGDNKRHWILDHLPNILHEQDFDFDDDSAQKIIAKMMHDGKFVGTREGTYEERVLRITVLEELFPITSLRKDSDYAQVFVDILQCHKWLYDHARILHRDISLANLMYRIDSKGNIICVLNDFDLSSLLPIDEATSLRRTGTPPYMAFDLLKEQEDSGPHLYRHDLEALFNVMLMICCRHSIIKEPQPQGMSQLEEIPKSFSRWFDRGISWDDLAELKTSFFVSTQPLPISSCFEAFRPWLEDIHDAFSEGLTARRRSKQTVKTSNKRLADDFNIDGSILPKLGARQEPQQAPFDEETLGGYVMYGMFLNIMQEFNGKTLILKNKDKPPAVKGSQIVRKAWKVFDQDGLAHSFVNGHFQFNYIGRDACVVRAESHEFNRTSGLQLMKRQQSPEKRPADIMVFMETIRGVDNAHRHNHDSAFPLRIVTLKTSAKGVSDEVGLALEIFPRIHRLRTFFAFRLPQGLEATAGPSPILPATAWRNLEANVLANLHKAAQGVINRSETWSSSDIVRDYSRFLYSLFLRAHWSKLRVKVG